MSTPRERLEQLRREQGALPVAASMSPRARLEQLRAQQGPLPQSTPGFEELTGGEALQGAVELAGGAASDLLTSVAGGVHGVAQTLNPMAPPGAGAQGVEDVKQYQYKPGSTGQRLMDAIGGTITEMLPDSVIEMGRDVATAIGESPDAVARQFGPGAGAVAKSLPTAIGLTAGAPGTKALATGLARAEVPVTDALTPTIAPSQKKQRIADLLNEGSNDPESAPFKTVSIEQQPIPTGGVGPDGGPMMVTPARQRVVKDPLAAEAIKQGLDPGMVNPIRNASKADRARMREMLDIMWRGKKDRLYRRKHRPASVLGDSVMKRYEIIRAANRRAGEDLDKSSLALRTARVDNSQVSDMFLEQLDDMGIHLGAKLDQVMRANRKLTAEDVKSLFRGSDIEMLPGDEKAIMNVVKRLGSDVNSAYDLHKLKRWIDRQVTFGKRDTGLSADTENLLKSLRHNIDTLLDDKFPAYKAANESYGETIDVLGRLRDRVDTMSPNRNETIGTVMRRITSNAVSRGEITDLVENLDSVARKYAGGSSKELVPAGMSTGPGRRVLDDTIAVQGEFVNEIEKMFGAAADTGFQNQTRQANVQAAGDIAKGAARGSVDPMGATIDYVASTAKRATGRSDEKAYKALMDLLKDQL